jgi:Protein of unknown function (DUF3311)
VPASSQQESSESGAIREGVQRSVFSPWNLLLIVPLLMLITPWFNHVNPRIGGVPFFYWSQLAFVPVSVLAMSIAIITTRGKSDIVNGQS